MSQKEQQWLAEALRQHQEGRLDKAWAGYQRVLKALPTHPDALHYSALISADRGNLTDAVRRLSLALDSRPDDAFALNDLACIREKQNDLAAAEHAFRSAIHHQPQFALAMANLGRLLASLDREDEAVWQFESALRCDTNLFEALHGLASIRMKQRHFGVARPLVDRLLGLSPDDPGVLLMGAELARADRRRGDEEGYVDRILARYPAHVSALIGKATLLVNSMRASEAIECGRKALRIDPGSEEAAAILSAALWKAGRAREAIDELNGFMASRPYSLMIASQFLFIANFDDRINSSDLVAVHRQLGTRFASLIGASPPGSPPANPKLRIGYLSPDFRHHSVAYFSLPVIARHDRREFEIYCYSATEQSDDITARFRDAADCWRDVCGRSAVAIAQQIAADQIDILVDLAGHTAGNSMEVFAHEPAPVQVTWLGYPGTTGVPSIGFRISDAVADPPGVGDTWNTERLLRLPDCFHCFRPLYADSVTPCHEPAAGRSIVFGSFNVAPKISDATIAAWARILAAAPDSRLLIKSSGLSSQETADVTLKRLGQLGIPPERIEIVGHVDSQADHLRLYNRVDIALDTFPYNGTTTTCEALWMGVPVVTWAGDRHAARVSASLLSAVGCPELIAADVDGYVEIAVALSRDRQRLDSMHDRLRGAMTTSPLMDEVRFTKNLETAFRDAWRQTCAERSNTADRRDG